MNTNDIERLVDSFTTLTHPYCFIIRDSEIEKINLLDGIIGNDERFVSHEFYRNRLIAYYCKDKEAIHLAYSFAVEIGLGARIF